MAVSDPLRDRLAALSPREKRFLFAGTIIVALFILYLLLKDSGDNAGDGDRVELNAAPPAASFPAAPPTAVGPPLTGAQPKLPPIGPGTPPAPVLSAPAAAIGNPASVSAMVLNGVFGGGPGGGAALISTQPGSQHLVRVGRQVTPGVTLKEVGINYALVATPSGDVRLQFSARPGPAPAQ